MLSGRKYQIGSFVQYSNNATQYPGWCKILGTNQIYLQNISLRCRTWHVSDDAFYLAQLAHEDYVDETIVAIVDNIRPDDSCDSCQ